MTTDNPQTGLRTDDQQASAPPAELLDPTVRAGRTSTFRRIVVGGVTIAALAGVALLVLTVGDRAGKDAPAPTRVVMQPTELDERGIPTWWVRGARS
jgi:hypothetical protein